jgi:hypothetical protein
VREITINGLKNFLKKFKKTLDKALLMWYNNYRKLRKEVIKNEKRN